MTTPGHVLVIDDEPSARRLLREYLSEAGAGSVSEASNGDDARALMAAQSPALILLDIHLPGMNGIDFLRDLRGRGDTTCVVIVSVDTASATVVSALKAGADGFIRKDAGREEFVRQLGVILA